MEPFLLRALAGAIAVALAAGPLGCFVVWRRMAYFGAALAHSALLGVLLGLLIGIRVEIGVAFTCIVIALGFTALERHRVLAKDALLGVIAHAALAFGLVALALSHGVNIDLMGYLFGDVLAIGPIDLGVMWVVGALTLVVLRLRWSELLMLTLSEELAAVEGVAVGRMRLLLVLLIALLVAVGMRVVGLLLIVSLLIIPAAAARNLARSPSSMAIIASAIGIFSVGTGLWASWRWDLPAGPAIVIAATGCFVLSPLPARVRAHRVRPEARPEPLA